MEAVKSLTNSKNHKKSRLKPRFRLKTLKIDDVTHRQTVIAEMKKK